MTNRLSFHAKTKNNNFNLIRFIAALLVLVSHSFILVSGSTDSEPLTSSLGFSLGSIAVDIFFVISGFLISCSYLHKNNLLSFIFARVLRIYPALITAVIFCIFIGLLFSSASIPEYFSSFQTWKFFIKNTILFLGVEYSLPGVFLENPYPNAVNGSLWTLPYEIKTYTALACTLFAINYSKKWITPINTNQHQSTPINTNQHQSTPINTNQHQSYCINYRLIIVLFTYSQLFTSNY